MRKVTICLIVLGVLALAFISMPMKAQNQGYPLQFAPSRTFRTPPAQGPLVPATKFLKLQNPIPNKYIVVLNDDVVSSSAPVDVRRAQVSAIANSLAQAHGGKPGFVYETALKGFSIELPNETAAIALSQNPQVKWVEGDGVVQEATVCESNPPWGLDRIDQITKLTPSPAPTPDSCDPNNPYTGLISQEPNESGLDFWTSQITATCGTGTDFNANNACTPGKRVDVSRAFWVDPNGTHAGWLDLNTNNLLVSNETFLEECYRVYLRRPSDAGGFGFWLPILNTYGNPANQAGVNFMIDKFITSLEYRQRLGQP